MSEVTPRAIWRHPIHLLSFGFGSGLAPKAPGTFGTVAAIVPWLFLAQLPLWLYVAVTVVALLVGIWLCDQTAEALGVHDHPAIVWDEWVGFFITMLAAPAGWQWVLAGFILFRIFDIAKPWPIRWVDRRIEGGTGIMLDDVLAGLMALVVLQVLAALV